MTDSMRPSSTATARVADFAADESFPRLKSRTQNFRLGAPRDIQIAGDGERVVFVRSGGPTDRVGALWVLDLQTMAERLVADPLHLLADDEHLSGEERARRERRREAAAGITGYALNDDGDCAVFVLSGMLFACDLRTGLSRVVASATPAFDPRLSPDGQQIAYTCDGVLRVTSVDSEKSDTALLSPEGAGITYGMAEFIAAEEMDRFRGFWWAPDGSSLLVARVDESPVQQWWIANPAQPEQAPTQVRYPVAGSDNADVSLVLVSLEGARTEIHWDRAAFPYMARISWSAYGVPLLLVQSRDQRRTQVLGVDVSTGATNLLHEQRDDHWIELVAGVPAWLPDGRLVTTVDSDDTRRLCVGGDAVTPPGLQVLAVTSVAESRVMVRATTDAVNVRPWLWGLDGSLTALGEETGVWAMSKNAGVTVTSCASLDWWGTHVTVRRDEAQAHDIVSFAGIPPLADAQPHEIFAAGERQITTAVLLPSDGRPGPLPVLLDPYGGPGHGRVVAARGAWLESQWLADQGYVVIVADGRGTPGRGPAWERAIAGTALSDAVLQDQVDALAAVAEKFPTLLDLSRVAIRGWSFGGYLAALAVLRRPDVFAAAVAGAPVTDWALYDTHYTERYLGTPADDSENYEAASLMPHAGSLIRPLMLIHGLADDNVVAAHTLRLSSALLSAGRQHTVLPLSGVSHMTPQEVVAENLLLLQMQFLHEALA